MLTATIYSDTESPEALSEPYQIRADNFSRIARRAKALAAEGTPCYIEWHRDSDHQRGYWGPRGACLAAHVYRSSGRPVTIGARKGQVSLDEASWAKARTLGDGNVSAGIRLALAKA